MNFHSVLIVKFKFRNERSSLQLHFANSPSLLTTAGIYVNIRHPLLAVSVKLFAVALDILEAVDRVWYKSLLSKLPSYGFYPSLCTFISSLLSGRSISAVVDGYCSKPKPVNSGVPQGSVLSPTLLILFINDLSITDCPIHPYADDSTLHYSITFKSRPSQIELHHARLDAAERLTSDLSVISMPQKPSFSFCLLDTTFQIPIPYSSTTHDCPPPLH